MIELDWELLRIKQDKLDSRIVIDKNLQGEYLTNKKILALLTEIGELANELPETFKFWSNKKNDYEKSLDEYVDCLHFVLSIENDFKFRKDNFVGAIKQSDLVTQFNRFNSAVSILSNEQNALYLQNVLTSIRGHLIGLGEMLGFTTQDVERAYDVKNKVNFERQAGGY